MKLRRISTGQTGRRCGGPYPSKTYGHCYVVEVDGLVGYYPWPVDDVHEIPSWWRHPLRSWRHRRTLAGEP